MYCAPGDFVVKYNYQAKVSRGFFIQSAITKQFKTPLSCGYMSRLSLGNDGNTEGAFAMPRPGESYKRSILERDAYICAYCDGQANQVDHILPYSFYPDNSELNLVACCELCNLIAGSKIFKSLSDKRTYIQKQRTKRKFVRTSLSICGYCGKPFKPRFNGSTLFYCEICAVYINFTGNQKDRYRNLISNGHSPKDAIATIKYFKKIKPTQ